MKSMGHPLVGLTFHLTMSFFLLYHCLQIIFNITLLITHVNELSYEALCQLRSSLYFY